MPSGGIRGRLTNLCVPTFNFSGMLVHIPGRAFTAVLGADGAFAFDFVPAGTYALSIEQSGTVIASVPNVAVTTAVVDLGDLDIADLMNDAHNCGACGIVCDPGTVCGGGTCTPSGVCPGDGTCSSHGVCTIGVCICSSGYTGADCSIPTGPPPICTEGSVQSCYSGPAGTANLGVCRPGTQTCVSGNWSACVNEVVPFQETCNGLDDDCDGIVDDNFNVGMACNTGVPGACAQGTIACQDGALLCASNIQPGSVVELCNGVDDDCNGVIDEGNPGGGAACGTGLPGVCSSGISVCTNGGIACSPSIAPGSQAEICDGLDDNCNGEIDEGVKFTYYRDVDNDGYGNPATSTQACTPPAGYVTSGTDCNDSNPNFHPGAVEVCDGVDDNCEGTIDEGGVCNTTNNCGSFGVSCAVGQSCAAGVCVTAVCTGLPEPPGRCIMNSDCLNGQTCDTATNECRCANAVSDCSFNGGNWTCTGGHCKAQDNAACNGFARVGGATDHCLCTSNTQCGTGLCNTGVCTCN